MCNTRSMEDAVQGSCAKRMSKQRRIGNKEKLGRKFLKKEEVRRENNGTKAGMEEKG